MDDGGFSCSAAAIKANVCSPEDVFRDYRARRVGIINALTKNMNEFYRQCDPEKENLCLYGLPDETWEVRLPPDLVPPELPEPTIGINFARDGIALNDWLLRVAAHSDSWLLSVAFYFEACYVFDKQARARLFTMINGLPSVFEVVSETVKNQPIDPNGGSKNKSGSEPKQSNYSNAKQATNDQATRKHKEEDAADTRVDEDPALTSCGACGEVYTAGGFWICCDVCEAWFHGECVRVTPAKAERIKRYECPGCNHKRIRLADG